MNIYLLFWELILSTNDFDLVLTTPMSLISWLLLVAKMVLSIQASQALDLVSRKILINRLHSLRIQGELLESYFIDRIQIVRILFFKFKTV